MEPRKEQRKNFQSACWCAKLEKKCQRDQQNGKYEAIISEGWRVEKDVQYPNELY